MRNEAIIQGKRVKLPFFYPVYQPKSNLIPIDDIKHKYKAQGLILNSFFLYKDAEVKQRFDGEYSVHDHIDFHGLVMTDSGAFQGLKRPLYLSNKKIVKFQNLIQSDIISPLDLISPPFDSYPVAEKKLISTIKRIKEAKPLAQNGVLAGVQQGGRFLDLRKRSAEALVEMGLDYIAIGSLVPFFNKGHNFELIIKILKDARQIVGPDLPMHVYGAGDPLELPFLVELGADIFDSSSYGHYAIGGWYMTQYGALTKEQVDLANDYYCDCDVCEGKNSKEAIFGAQDQLAQHNLYTIYKTIETINQKRASGNLTAWLDEILEIHSKWFPDSLLMKSWEATYV